MAFRDVAEELSNLDTGEHYMNWYEGSRKQMVPVGNDPKLALAKLGKKRLELACVVAGWEIWTNRVLPVEYCNSKRCESLNRRLCKGKIFRGGYFSLRKQPFPRFQGRCQETCSAATVAKLPSVQSVPSSPTLLGIGD